MLSILSTNITYSPENNKYIVHLRKSSYSYNHKCGTMDQINLVDEVNQLHADLCGALADPRRILILYMLRDRELNVSELAAEIGISQPAASRHLKLLRERGLVFPVRVGSSVNYRLTDLRLLDALDTLRDVLRDRLARSARLMQSEL